MKEIKQLQKQLSHAEALMAVRFRGQSALVEVNVRADKKLDDLLHIDRQKHEFLSNFDAFLADRPFQHVLLWGARGTGKSTLVRAAFLHYQQQVGEKLAVVQLDNQDLDDVGAVIWAMGQAAPKRFVLFIDDVSFSVDDERYKALKAVLDGAIAAIPSNVLLVLTSNRRHLLRDEHQDNNAIHPEEDSEERISLSERFGLRLAFHPLSQEEYLAVVRDGLGRDWHEDLRQSALQFALAHGSRSARVAMQFVAHTQGQNPNAQSALFAEKKTLNASPQRIVKLESRSNKVIRCKKSCDTECDKPCKKARKKAEKKASKKQRKEAKC